MGGAKTILNVEDVHDVVIENLVSVEHVEWKLRLIFIHEEINLVTENIS